MDELAASLDDSGFGSDGAISADAKFKGTARSLGREDWEKSCRRREVLEGFGSYEGEHDRAAVKIINLRNKRVRNFVAGEGDVVVLEETSADQVAQGVILLVEGEDRGGGDAYISP